MALALVLFGGEAEVWCDVICPDCVDWLCHQAPVAQKE